MAEQMSWTKPGSVNSAERAPPPKVELASSTSTERPARPSVPAADRPLGPEPTTIASYLRDVVTRALPRLRRRDKRHTFARQARRPPRETPPPAVRPAPSDMPHASRPRYQHP